jgi:hypothetical protein
METPTLLGPLESANLSHCTIHEVEIKFRLTVSRTVCLGVGLPSATKDQIFLFCLTIVGFLMLGTLSGKKTGL